MNLVYNDFIREKYFEKLEHEKSGIYFFNFRKYEYEHKLKDLIDTAFEYVKTILGEDNFTYKYEIRDYYVSAKYNRTELYEVVVWYKIKLGNEQVEERTSFLIPKLVNDYMFFIYGNVYIPIVKLKERSLLFGPSKIMLRTPFANLTIVYSCKDEGERIPRNDIKAFSTIAVKSKIHSVDLFHFLYRDYDPQFLQELSDFLETDLSTPTIFSTEVKQFIETFDLFSKEKNLSKVLDSIFLKNDFIRRLVEYEVGFKVSSIAELIKIIFKEFIFKGYFPFSRIRDLSNRRFIFLEDIMMPFTRAIVEYLVALSTRQRKINLNIGKEKVVGCFISGSESLGLKPAKYIYDFATPYSGVRSFVSIQGDGDVRKYMLSLHETYRNIICPISTSSTDPGVQIHINPNTKLSYFGHIEEHFKPMKYYIEEGRKCQS